MAPNIIEVSHLSHCYILIVFGNVCITGVLFSCFFSLFVFSAFVASKFKLLSEEKNMTALCFAGSSLYDDKRHVFTTHTLIKLLRRHGQR